MKLVNIREARATLADLVEHAQNETVVILRHGKPVATLQGTRGADLQTVLTAGDPEFWRELERRRREPSRSLAEAELAARSQHRRPAKSSPARPARKGISGGRSAARRRKMTTPAG